MVSGVETAVWTITTRKVGKWYRGVLEAAEGFMVKWHEDEATLSSIRSWRREGNGRRKPRLMKAGRKRRIG